MFPDRIHSGSICLHGTVCGLGGGGMIACVPVNADMSLEICRDPQLHGRHPCVD